MEERNFPSCATLPNSFITHVGCGGAGEKVGERGEGKERERRNPGSVTVFPASYSQHPSSHPLPHPPPPLR